MQQLFRFLIFLNQPYMFPVNLSSETRWADLNRYGPRVKILLIIIYQYSAL